MASISSCEAPFSKAAFLSFSRCLEKTFDEYLLAWKKKSAISHTKGIAPITASTVWYQSIFKQSVHDSHIWIHSASRYNVHIIAGVKSPISSNIHSTASSQKESDRFANSFTRSSAFLADLSCAKIFYF